ncbi:tautomerase family protein [Mycolicibacter senuensis]|uniref:tautomerase family protein n=1 Tax=Mycolicibacter senuensis TaxID=386913 RepID=UPI000DCDCBAD|nr:tautomerase family protein [Mycolicibacter senuensis]RAV02965.1 cis-3-chloroacrylic acid dehalogenase [Mycolicibacter senuensis]
MPIYQCYSPAGLLNGPQKRRIAQEITAIHTEQTGAPELFVNVLFHQIADGDCFVAGKTAAHSYLFGLIRHGRDIDTRQQMLRQLSRMWTAITGQPESEFLVALTEADSANAMEGGLVLPEPGQETRWFAENQTRLSELGMTT